MGGGETTGPHARMDSTEWYVSLHVVAWNPWYCGISIYSIYVDSPCAPVELDTKTMYVNVCCNVWTTRRARVYKSTRTEPLPVSRSPGLLV